jgi:hypothetical protein
MNKQLDPHYFKAHGACLDCVKKKETKLKTEGKWETTLKKSIIKKLINL